MSKKPVVLVVLDGWGLEESKDNNGVALADTPNFDYLSTHYPFTTLQASGEAVGLPAGQMGNSEVGHSTIGAGTVIYQDLVRINKDVEVEAFQHNPAFIKAFNHVKTNGSQLHIIGLLSTGGVHSHEDHFVHLVEVAQKAGVEKIVLHPLLDGRDSSPTGGAESLARLEKLGIGTIASVAGRYYTMDRDKNWDRTDKGFDAFFAGKAEHTYTDKQPSEVIKDSYAQEKYDELMEPMVFLRDGEPITVHQNDSIIYTNFRSDRTRQLSHRIRAKVDEMNLCFVTMTDYGDGLDAIVAYEPQSIEETLAGVVSKAGLRQAHLAETDKYAHATYFLNGGRDEPHDGEDQILVPSRKDVKTHDQAPEMKAKELTDETIAQLKKKRFHLPELCQCRYGRPHRGAGGDYYGC